MSRRAVAAGLVVVVLAGCQPQDPPVHERVRVQLSHLAPDGGCLVEVCSATVDAQSGEVSDNRVATSDGTYHAGAMAELYAHVADLPEDACPPAEQEPWRLDYAVFPPPSIAERADLAVHEVPWCHLDQQALDELRPLWEAAGGWWPAS